MITEIKESRLSLGNLVRSLNSNRDTLSLGSSASSQSIFESTLPTSSTSSGGISAMAVPGGRAFLYNITATGTTYSGNTSFPLQNTRYTPAVNFTLPGTLVIEPTLAAQNSNRTNGVNPREVGLFIGNDASLITAGTLRYGTHTWMHRYWGGRTTGRPALDTAFVSVNNQTDRLSVSVDQQWSRNDTSNLFSWRSSLASAPKQILAGSINIQFTNGGRNVSGTVTFFGNGFVEPGAYAYAASFTGTLRG